MVEKPYKVTEYVGCVCPFPRNRCEPSKGMVFVICARCGAIQRIEYYEREKQKAS